MKFNKIIILGGGSAGWMSAATFIKCFPKKDITLIEGPNYATVGVGESTIAGVREWTDLLELNDRDFMRHTDASYKLSIRFEDFYKKGDGGFHYPFGRTYIGDNKFQHNDWYFKKIFEPDLPVTDYADSYYPQMALVNANKILSDQTRPVLENFRFKFDTAFHFDATKFGLWLKEHYCLPRGVKYISEDIKSIEHDKNGIISLNKKHKADLYIDCTGFKSMLLSETLKEPFNSFTDMLPNNRAWATRVPYIDKKKELNTYTNCTAIGNGWVWSIPLWSRIGTGYVYSNKYISDEDALKEFKEYLMKKEPYKLVPCDHLEFKNIKMRVGLHERLFVKNVVAIGLSAGFIEPLESNGLFTVHKFLVLLMKTLNRENRTDISQFDRDNFNLIANNLFRNFAEFVAMHYALSHRDDTHYWRDVKNKVFDLLSVDNSRLSKFKEFILNKNIKKYYPLEEGISCVATGYHNFPITVEDLYTDGYYNLYGNNLKNVILKNTAHLNVQKLKWKNQVKNEKTIFEYLRDNIYNDD